MRILKFYDDHHSSVLCSLDTQFNNHAVHGVVAWARTVGNAVHAFISAEERVSAILSMLPLRFNSSCDGITVLKQSANRAIILT